MTLVQTGRRIIHVPGVSDVVAEARSIIRQILTAERPAKRALVALSGGSTPIALYQSIAADHEDARLVASRSSIWFSDERAVPPEHPDSNYRTANLHLLSPIGMSEQYVHRLNGEALDLRAEADRYGSALRAACAAAATESFDLVMLGMGADGHTASLFPENEADLHATAPVIATTVASKKSDRLTISLALINTASMVLFLVTGADKAGMVRRVLTEPASTERPASLVAAQRTIWLLDEASAAELPASIGTLH